VGVPGTLSVLEMAHQEHGKLPWPRLIQPAIDLATSGFKISPRLHAALLETPDLKNDPVARHYFFDPKGMRVTGQTNLLLGQQESANRAIDDDRRVVSRRGRKWPL
jgi:gamma-glutamyltranspeptidase/glutathione hydrolase